MYYMIIIVRHSVFEKELVILFYLFKKIFKQIKFEKEMYYMIIFSHSSLKLEVVVRLYLFENLIN